jgi:uncharacterized protein with GYD domain
MTTYFMFGNYSVEAYKEISADRTDSATILIKQLGGKVKDIYALLGQDDLVLIVDFPDLEQVVKASLALSKMTGIKFRTAPAISVENFDKLTTEI